MTTYSYGIKFNSLNYNLRKIVIKRSWLANFSIDMEKKKTIFALLVNLLINEHFAIYHKKIDTQIISKALFEPEG